MPTDHLRRMYFQQFGRQLAVVQAKHASERVALEANLFAQVSAEDAPLEDRKSTRLNSSHVEISYAVFCLKKKKKKKLKTKYHKKQNLKKTLPNVQRLE